MNIGNLKKMRSLIVLAFLAFFCLASKVEISEEEEDGAVVYLQRYCELLQLQWSGLFGILSEVKLEVWSTFRLNECPQQSWDALSVPFSTLRNGPRYWLMDRIKASGETKENLRRSEVRDWGGLELFKLATVSFSNVFELLSKALQRHFSITRVDRDTEFIWNTGTRVYVLFNGTHSWVMQSFYTADQPDMGSKLSNLGSLYHKQPMGWEYESCVLTEQLRVGASGIAYVIQDEFSNTFQLYDVPMRICSSSFSSPSTSKRDEL